MQELIGKDYTKSTLQRYQTCLMHCRDFMHWRNKASDIEVSKIDFAFLTDFEYYLRSVRRCSNNSAIKYIKNLGKIVRYCIGNGWIKVDPYLNYKPKSKPVVREAVNKSELERLEHKVFSIERLTIVRDIFLFSCYTELSYVDVQKLKRNSISEGIDGKLWIMTKRHKTGVVSKIPLLPIPQAIVFKYSNHPICLANGSVLPVSSNQKMNAYLKEVADLCGIKKTLTFHIARHTFATTITLNNGVYQKCLVILVLEPPRYMQS